MNLTKLVDLENVSLDMEASHPCTGEKAKEVFCAGWPATKNGLEIAQAMVKNPIVKMIVGICIALGDGISNRICGEAKAEATSEG